jgi:hypothetical protein
MCVAGGNTDRAHPAHPAGGYAHRRSSTLSATGDGARVDRPTSGLRAVGYALAVVFPLGGFVFWLMLVNRGRGRTGFLVITLSVVLTGVWAYVLVGGHPAVTLRLNRCASDNRRLGTRAEIRSHGPSALTPADVKSLATEPGFAVPQRAHRPARRECARPSDWRPATVRRTWSRERSRRSGRRGACTGPID